MIYTWNCACVGPIWTRMKQLVFLSNVVPFTFHLTNCHPIHERQRNGLWQLCVLVLDEWAMCDIGVGTRNEFSQLWCTLTIDSQVAWAVNRETWSRVHISIGWTRAALCFDITNQQIKQTLLEMNEYNNPSFRVSQSQSYFATDGQSVSQYVLVSSPFWDFWPEIFVVVESYSLVLFGAPSLMRGRVCHLSVFCQYRLK
jgi:hypothetical protein